MGWEVYAHYHLNEISGRQVLDSSGNNRSGSCVNMEDSDWVSGKLNNCLFFDGINEHIRYGTIANFNRFDSFSLECWIKRSRFNIRDIICTRMRTSSNYRGYGLFIESDNKLNFVLVRTFGSDYIHVNSVSGIDDTNWHHVVVTYDGSGLASGVNIYLDGHSLVTNILADSLTGSITGTRRFFIARWGNSYFQGNIDEFVIYNEELTLGKVLFRWNNGIGRENFKEESENGFDGCIIFSEHLVRNVNGRILIQKSSDSYLNSQVVLYKYTDVKLDGRIFVFSFFGGNTSFDGRITIARNSNRFLDAHVDIYSCLEHVVDGKIFLYKCSENFLNSKIYVSQHSIRDIDGKVFLCQHSSCDIDGRVFIFNFVNQNTIFNGKIVLHKRISKECDGRVNFYRSSISFLDGKIIIYTRSNKQFNAKISIYCWDFISFDGKLIVNARNEVTVYLNGRVRVRTRSAFILRWEYIRNERQPKHTPKEHPILTNPMWFNFNDKGEDLGTHYPLSYYLQKGYEVKSQSSMMIRRNLEVVIITVGDPCVCID